MPIFCFDISHVEDNKNARRLDQKYIMANSIDYFECRPTDANVSLS